jgi:hypothetical protein
MMPFQHIAGGTDSYHKKCLYLSRPSIDKTHKHVPFHVYFIFHLYSAGNTKSFTFFATGVPPLMTTLPERVNSLYLFNENGLGKQDVDIASDQRQTTFAPPLNAVSGEAPDQEDYVCIAGTGG